MDATWREVIPGKAVDAIRVAARRGDAWRYVARDSTHAALVRAALRADEGFGARPFWGEPVTDVVRWAEVDRLGTEVAGVAGPLFFDPVDDALDAWQSTIAKHARNEMEVICRAPAPRSERVSWTLFDDTVAEARAVSRWAALHVTAGARVGVLVPNAAVAGRLAEALLDESIPFSSTFGSPLREFASVGVVRAMLESGQWMDGDVRRVALDHAQALFESLAESGFEANLARATIAADAPDGIAAFATCREVLYDVAHGMAMVSDAPVTGRAFATLALLALETHRTRPRFDASAPVFIIDAQTPQPLPVDAIAVVGVCRSYYGSSNESAELVAARERWGLSAPLAASERVLAVTGFAAAIAGDAVWVSGAERHGDERLLPIRELLPSAVRGVSPPPRLGSCASARRVTENNIAVERARHGPWAPSPYDGVLSPSVAESVRERLGRRSRELSASQLDDYIVCPFRYFARRVLGVEEPAPAGGDIGANDVGTLVHDVLATFYAKQSAEERGAARDAAWAAVALTRLREIAESRLAATGWPTAYAARVRHELFGNASEAGLIARFVDEEVKLKTRPFLIEARFGSTTHGVDQLSSEPLPVCDGDGRVVAEIRGAIDRVDVAPDGRALVLYDYKTGAVSESPAKRILAGTSFQLPVYLLALARAFDRARPVVFGGLYALHDARRAKDFGPRDKYQLRDRARAEAAGLGRGFKSTGRRDDFDEILGTVERAISVHVGAMRAGRFPAGALDEATMGCHACAFALACRTDPVRALEVVARRPAEFPLPLLYEAIDAEGEDDA